MMLFGNPIPARDGIHATREFEKEPLLDVSKKQTLVPRNLSLHTPRVVKLTLIGLPVVAMVLVFLGSSGQHLGSNLLTSADLIMSKDEINEWKWENGLPINEGLTLQINTDNVKSENEMRKLCENNTECVGFAESWANCPPKKKWFYPKVRGTGFAEAKTWYTQKYPPEHWTWHYLVGRVENKKLGTVSLEGVTGKILDLQAYMNVGGVTLDVKQMEKNAVAALVQQQIIPPGVHCQEP